MSFRGNKGGIQMYLHGTSRINGQGHLEIGGCDTTQLANNTEHHFMYTMKSQFEEMPRFIVLLKKVVSLIK